jgi:hypothetical protein
LIAARLFLFAFGLAYIDPSTGQTIASARITAWRKQSGGQSGSFQDLVLKGQALGLCVGPSSKMPWLARSKARKRQLIEAACSRKIKQLAIALWTLGSMLGAPDFYQGFGGLSHRVDLHTQRS